MNIVHGLKAALAHQQMYHPLEKTQHLLDNEEIITIANGHLLFTLLIYALMTCLLMCNEMSPLPYTKHLKQMLLPLHPQNLERRLIFTTVIDAEWLRDSKDSNTMMSHIHHTLTHHQNSESQKLNLTSMPSVTSLNSNCYWFCKLVIPAISQGNSKSYVIPAKPYLILTYLDPAIYPLYGTILSQP